LLHLGFLLQTSAEKSIAPQLNNLVAVLVDVRRFPKSRRVPWTESSTLKKLLEGEGITYVWLGDLLGFLRG